MIAQDHDKKVIKTCKKCKTKFELGKDGIWSWDDEDYLCDSCAGVTRVADQYSDHTAYLPGETIPAESN